MTHRNRVSKYLLLESGDNKRRVTPNVQLVKKGKKGTVCEANKAKHNETRYACAGGGRGSTPPQFTPLNLSLHLWPGRVWGPDLQLKCLI